MHSQTPYGPHVPIGVAGLSLGGGMPMQEDISTIFVVGFPEDMQEREFQNMFTFSPGFEAATLKIPNKEYTAYGGVLSPQPQHPSLNNPVFNANNGNGNSNFNNPNANPRGGANDPYNLVTVNQGGVLVDAGREGGIAPPGQFSSSTLATNPNAGLASSGTLLPPRKQIIGFAKFRTREEALGARDVLQGRRVDIDKGAVLKAEMAKKNLHTKRGVGLMGPPMGVGVHMGGMGMNGGGMN
ncbi:hypothetical protein K438DRAFT_1563487, partial [Mycena galopus ATCC 62051]